ncbi:substrate-binding domain-containing protein [Pseudonocardia kujensis]|uniref:substrate-binding domain-containing protein n=1 Tax=Pseudonocardia kujensis TaxID=1128675 RepID=UPI001E65076F|nr:substrate-binding domain-containing protein [Pseudonocardia kujensis]MCE0763601.1 substrate-binding domain-containing protein [Pseudonocardia kujensis]
MDRSLRRAVPALLTAVLAAGLTACSQGGGPAIAGPACDTAPYDQAIAAYSAGGVLAKGPNGETSPDHTSITLTEDEVARVRGMGATAAIVMHFSGDSWSNAQVSGITSELDRLGIRVVAKTDAQADPAKQFSDVETALAARPTVMLSIPSLDATALAPAFRKAADAGVKLVFMENPATGFTPGADYVSVVATDNYGAGVIDAHQMAKALCGTGSVGVIRHAAQAPTNVLRAQGFTDTLAQDYPGIRVVEDKGLLGPDWKGEGSSSVNAWLTKHPDLGGVWCWFDAPCEGAIDAARSSGRPLAVTTIDLGDNVAIDMAQNAYVKGIAAAQPYQQGVAEARLAAYGLLGKQAPAFVALPALPVDRANLLDSWQTVYETPAPADLQTALESG